MRVPSILLCLLLHSSSAFDHRGEASLVGFLDSLKPSPCSALLSAWRPVDYEKLRDVGVTLACEQLVSRGGINGLVDDPSAPCVAEGSMSAAKVGNNTCVRAASGSPSFCDFITLPCAVAANCYWELPAPEDSAETRSRVYTDGTAADDMEYLKRYGTGFAAYTLPAIACALLGLYASLSACCCIDGGCRCIPRLVAVVTGRRPPSSGSGDAAVRGARTACGARRARCKEWRIEWGWPGLVACSSLAVFAIVLVAFAFGISVAVHVTAVEKDTETSLGDFVTFAGDLVVPLEKLAYTDLPNAQSQLSAALNVSGVIAGDTEAIVASFDGLSDVLSGAVLPTGCDVASLPECVDGGTLIPGTECCYTCNAAPGCAAMIDETNVASSQITANIAPISDALAELRVTLVNNLVTASETLLPLLAEGSSTLDNITASVSSVKASMHSWTVEYGFYVQLTIVAVIVLVFLLAFIVAVASPCGVCLLSTVCKKCDPATPLLYSELDDDDVDDYYNFGGGESGKEDEEEGGASLKAGATAKTSLLSKKSKSKDKHTSKKQQQRTGTGVMVPDPAEIDAVQKYCKCLFSCCWLLSLVVLLFGTLASAVSFPAMAAVNDVCSVANVVVKNISGLGLLPHLAEEAAASCFGNETSLLDALDLGDKLDFAAQMGSLLDFIDGADIAAEFAPAQAMAENLTNTITGYAQASSIPGLYSFNATAFAQSLSGLDAVARCDLPTVCPVPGGACPDTVPIGCPYTANTAAFTRVNVAAEPWIALGDVEPTETPTAYMNGKFNDQSSPEITQWSALVISAWQVVAANAKSVDSIDALLTGLESNASAISSAMDNFALTLTGVQSSLSELAATTLTEFTTDATNFKNAAQCDFVLDAYAKLHADVCEGLLLDGFVLSLCATLVVIAMLPLAIFGPSFGERFSMNRALSKIRKFTSTTIERVRAMSGSSRAGSRAGGARPAGVSYVAMGSSGTFARSATTGARTTKPSSTPSTRAVIATFYAIFNPAKLDDVDALLAQYEGNTRGLYAKMREKYGADPEVIFRERKGTGGSAPPTTRAIVETYYSRFNSEKMDEVDTIVQKFGTNEKKLFAALQKKYGADPLAVYAAAAERSAGSGDNGGESYGVQVDEGRLGIYLRQDITDGTIRVDRFAPGSALRSSVSVGDQLISAGGVNFIGYSMDKAMVRRRAVLLRTFVVLVV